MCAHAVRVAIGKIDGVTSATVSLNEGMATVRFAPSHGVSIERIREAIRDYGFAPKEAEVRVAGILVRRGNTLALAVPGAGDSLLLEDAPGAAGKTSSMQQLGPNAKVVVTGRVPASDSRSPAAPRMLLVQSFVAEQNERLDARQHEEFAAIAYALESFP